jgi:hypothetical protein
MVALSLFRKGRMQRKYPRVRPERGRPIRVDINGVDFLDIVYADNLCEGGLAIMVPHEFKGCKIDQPVSLILTLPSRVHADVVVSGIIRYISYTRKLFGVAFVNLKQEERRKIHEYVDYRLEEQSIPLSPS